MGSTQAVTFSSFTIVAGLATCLAHCAADVDPEDAWASGASAILGGGICPAEVPKPPPSIKVMFCQDFTVPTDPGVCTSSALLDHCAFFPLSGCTQEPAVSPVGTQPVALTCYDSDGHAYTCHERLTVVDQEAPTIACPAEATLGCAGELPVSATDNCGATTVSCLGPGGAFDPASFDVSSFSLGVASEVTCSATDASGNQSSCTIAVTREAGPPVIHLASGPLLWPPNHKPHTIAPMEDCVSSITDACGNPITDAVLSIVGVTSDEVQDAPGAGQNGDGHTCDDIVIHGSSVSVLAERDGTSNGRVYSIRFAVSTPGGSAEAACLGIVPHDQGKVIPADVDDGCHLCVGDCAGVCEGHTSGPGCPPCPTPDPACDY